MTDWPTLKMGYEILGTDVPTLAEKGSTTVAMIEYAIKEEGWNRQEIANLLAKPAVPGDILVDVQDRLEALYTLAQSGFNERYLELESAVLSKAIAIVTSIEADKEYAPIQLEKVNNILNTMKEQAMLSGKARQADGKDGKGGVTIQIMQQFGKEGADKVDEAFEIKVEGDHTTPLKEFPKATTSG